MPSTCHCCTAAGSTPSIHVHSPHSPCPPRLHTLHMPLHGLHAHPPRPPSMGSHYYSMSHFLADGGTPAVDTPLTVKHHLVHTQMLATHAEVRPLCYAPHTGRLHYLSMVARVACVQYIWASIGIGLHCTHACPRAACVYFDRWIDRSDERTKLPGKQASVLP